jgi:hypothetical protein
VGNSTLNIDAVFTVTPFHAQEDFLLRACKDLGKKMITLFYHLIILQREVGYLLTMMLTWFGINIIIMN